MGKTILIEIWGEYEAEVSYRDDNFEEIVSYYAEGDTWQEALNKALEQSEEEPRLTCLS